MTINEELDRCWEETIKPVIIKCISISNEADTKPQKPFNLKRISWKIKGGDVVTDKIPVWGSTFAYTREGEYHKDIRGELVRYLEYYGKYTHHEKGESWDITLNEWKDNTYVNVRKQRGQRR